MLLTLLAVLFIALKLLGVITWSWFWVLSPLTIPIILVLVAWFAASMAFVGVAKGLNW